MAISKNSNNERFIEELCQNLETTTKFVQDLLNDIREGEIDFASIKTELRILVETVKNLTLSVKETDNGFSKLKIDIALLEKSVLELETWVKNKKLSEEQSSTAISVAKISGRWQMITAVCAGSLALIASIGTIIIEFVMK